MTLAHPNTSQRLPPRPRSLALRLTLWYAVSASVLLGVATVAFYWVLVTNLLREDDEFLAGKVEVIRDILANKDGTDTAMELQWEVENAERSPRKDMQVLLRFLDADNRPVMATDGMDKLLPASIFPPPVAARQEADKSIDVIGPDGLRHRVVSAKAQAVPLPGLTGKLGEWTIQVALIEEDEDVFLAKFRRELWAMLAIAVVACAAAGFFIARRGLRPLGDVADTVRRIRPTSLGQRVSLANVPAELADLASSFNAMMDRLEDSFDRLSRFSADIAHELRTPIHNLRGTTEVALGQARTAAEYRDVLVSNLEESGRISRLIDNLLFIARAENPRTAIQRVEMNVADELATILDFYTALADEAGVTLSLKSDGALTASLDRSLFQRAVGNLLENALAYTPRGGSVLLRASARDATLTVTVQDTGAGIPPEHLPHVFERFHRADPSRARTSGGFGLGLSLVRSIATLHNGAASIQSTPGSGTTVTLTFPAAPPPPS